MILNHMMKLPIVVRVMAKHLCQTFIHLRVKTSYSIKVIQLKI